MKILISIIAGIVVVGAAIFGISKLTSTSNTVTNAPVADQSISGTASAGDFGNCDLSGYSSVKVVGSGLGLKDTTMAIQGGKVIETIKAAGSEVVVDRTTSVCAGWVDSYKSSMTYNTLDSAYNPKGINTKGVWFSMTGNSQTNLKEITENGKAVLVFETRSPYPSKPGYIMITQMKADKARGLELSVTNIIYPSSDMMTSTPIEQISKDTAINYQTATFTYE